MNLFRFLISTKGAIKPLNALLISGVAGAVFFYTANIAANKQIEAERAVRTLTSIEGTAPEQGMRRQGDLLTSINVRDGRNQLATADERAALKGNSPLDRYEANQRALENMDSSLGRAAQFSESEGLNTGNRNAVQTPDRFTVGNPNIADVETDVTHIYRRRVHDGSTGPGQNGGGAQLANASMARASGSSFGGTSGSVSGGTSAQGRTNAGGEGPSRLSGAMPGGSNIVSQRENAGLGGGGGTSSFNRDRNGRITRGHDGGSDANELKDIVKKSAAAARNTDTDSANEGGRPFLASAVNSVGVQVSGAGESPTTSSGDLATPTNQKLNAIGNKLQQVEDEQEQRKKDQKRLILLLLGTTLASLGMMVAGSFILDKLKGTLWYYAVAAVMLGIVATLANTLYVAGKHFVENYGASGGVGIGTVAKYIAPILFLGMGYVVLRPQDIKGLIKKQWDKHIKPKFTKKAITKEATGFVKSESKKGILSWLDRVGFLSMFK